jgi:type VI secretion system secreted protein VgrG
MPGEFQSFLQGRSPLSTANRALRLLLGFQDGNRDDILLPQRVIGLESICGGLEYSVLCLAVNAALPLKEFIGMPVELQLVTDRGELRRVCGIVAEARAGNSDGGLASYSLLIRDALALMSLRCNSRVFRNKNEIDVIRTLFGEWIRNNAVLVGAFELEVDHLLDLRKFPQREFIRQYNESDANFVRRLKKRRGIAWFIRPGRSRAGSANANSERPAHTLVLFDGAYSVAQNKAGTVRFHRDDATEKRDTITSWCGVRSMRPGSVTRQSADYFDPHGRFSTVTATSAADQGPVGNPFAATLDDYLVEAPHAGSDSEDFLKLGQLRMARHDYETKCYHGAGSVRDFCVGEYFTLSGHPEIDRHPQGERDFVITQLRVHAVNNLPSDLIEKAERLFESNHWEQLGGRFASAKARDDQHAIRSRNEFVAVRRGIRIVPEYDPRVDLPPTRLESAIVVGPQNEEVHCDRIGRVKIRFPSSRTVDHEHAQGAGASGTDEDSAWVRVASNWAGNGPGSQHQCGALGLPRIGSDVLVDCLGGDPDKPIIVGQLYNDFALPPGISEMGELPGNRYLSGLRSREIKGSRGNRLQLDDTTGQISAKLASDHGHSELNLGWLTQPRSNGAGKPRGEGAELRSDKAVAVRGAEGVLISASSGDGRPGEQLERSELLGMVQVFASVAEELAKLAHIHNIAGDKGEHLPRLLERLRQWDNGTNVSLGTQTPTPIVAVTAPAGIILSSQDNLALGAESQIDVVSPGPVDISSGKDVSLHAAASVKLFAHQLGMQLIAAAGNVALQAHNGDIELTTSGRIRLHAGQGIELQAPSVKIVAEGAQADFADGSITQQSSGPHAIKSPVFTHTRQGNGNPAGISFPSTNIHADERLILFDQATGAPLAGRRYRLDLEDGRTISGITDEHGRTELATSESIGRLNFTIFPSD